MSEFLEKFDKVPAWRKRRFLSRLNDEQMREFVQDYKAYKPKERVVDESAQTAPEADLGVVTRSMVALEPLSSEDERILINKFGEERVSRDKEGNLYVHDGYGWRPVNKPGLGAADLAEAAGALPEFAGDIAGKVAGFKYGGPLGSMALGGVLSAVGSGVRQGMSEAAKKAAGMELKALPGERAKEVGWAFTFGAGTIGAIEGVIKAYKLAGKTLAPIQRVIKKYLPDMDERAIKAMTEDEKTKDLEWVEEMIRKQNIEATKSPSPPPIPMRPRVVGAPRVIEKTTGEKLAEGLTGGEKAAGEMAELAEFVGVRPTPGHLFPGSTLDKFEKYMELRPLAGIPTRIRTRGIENKVVENLEEVLERKISTVKDYDETVGEDLMGVLQDTISGLRQKAEDLYQTLEDALEYYPGEGKVQYREILEPLLRYGKNTGLIDVVEKNVNGRIVKDAVPVPIALGKMGTTVEENKRLQQMIMGMYQTIKNTRAKGRATIDWQELRGLANTARKSYETGGKLHGAYDVELLKVENIIRNVMDKSFKDKNLASTHRLANEIWGQYKGMVNATQKGGKITIENIDNENFLRGVFKNSERVNNLREIIGPDAVKRVGLRHLANIMAKGFTAGSRAGGRAFEELSRNPSAWKAAIGPRAYKIVRENLRYIVNTGIDINPSGTAKTQIIANLLSLKGILGEGVTLAAQVAAPVVSQFAKHTSRKAKGQTFRTGTKISALSETLGVRPKEKTRFDRGPRAWFHRGLNKLPKSVNLDSPQVFTLLVLDPKGRRLVSRYGESKGMRKMKILNQIREHLGKK